jgi:hypothetical protein
VSLGPSEFWKGTGSGRGGKESKDSEINLEIEASEGRRNLQKRKRERVERETNTRGVCATAASVGSRASQLESGNANHVKGPRRPSGSVTLTLTRTTTRNRKLGGDCNLR